MSSFGRLQIFSHLELSQFYSEVVQRFVFQIVQETQAKKWKTAKFRWIQKVNLAQFSESLFSERLRMLRLNILDKPVECYLLSMVMQIKYLKCIYQGCNFIGSELWHLLYQDLIRIDTWLFLIAYALSIYPNIFRLGRVSLWLSVSLMIIFLYKLYFHNTYVYTQFT